MKNDPRIGWRMVMFLFVNRFLSLVNNATSEPSDELRYLIY